MWLNILVYRLPRLVGATLGLWSLILDQRDEPHIRPIFDEICKDIDSFFPPTFDFLHKECKAEPRRELFGESPPLVGPREFVLTSASS